MFGGPLKHPGYPKPRPKPFIQDIQMPSVDLCYGHLGREPNTNHHVRLLHYKQRENEYSGNVTEKDAVIKEKELIHFNWIKHTDKRHLQYQIKHRVEEKLKKYEEEVEKRRAKLEKLLAEEERKYYWEAVDQAQRGDETRIDEMKIRVKQLQAQKERERQEIVKEKRIQQYMDRCLDLRVELEKRHVQETKECQLQQMRENESRREADRELEKFWYDVMVKEIEAKRERELQDELARKKRDFDCDEVRQKQIEAERLLKEEEARVAEEDRLQFLKVREQMMREEEEAKLNKTRKRDQLARELKEQVEAQRELMARRKMEEDALEAAFNKLAQLELQKELDMIKDTTSAAKKEMAMYRQELARLQVERKEEEKKLDRLLEEYRISVQKKQDEAKCKIEEAKRRLHESVLEDRAAQIRYKKEEAEQQLRMKEAENELLRLNLEMHKKLDEEAERQRIEAVRQYNEDLQKQIEYNNILRAREKAEMERQLELGRLEEEKFRKLVEDFLSGEKSLGEKHPFRKVLERYDCHCKPIIKPKY